MSESQTKAGNQECFAKLANLQNLQIYPWDMLNNFCFNVYVYVYAQNAENCNAFLGPPVSLEFMELVPS